MIPQDVVVLGALFLVVALLYSSVGHGGASGYLAVMALWGLSVAEMKPTALSLNILVSLIATVQFARARAFVWEKFWPFAMVSIPLAYVGGSLALPAVFYKRLVGAILLFSAYRLFQRAKTVGLSTVTRAVPRWLALASGSAIGFLSGLVGVGGGIFLSPLLLLAGWADARSTAAISAAFILVNSAAGLLGHVASVKLIPAELPVWAVAVGIGGLVGSTVGSRRLPNPTLRRLLAVVLVIAGWKLILT